MTIKMQNNNSSYRQLACVAQKIDASPKIQVIQQQSLNLAKKYRKDFPILKQKNQSNYDVIYFDNAATSQKPQYVLDVQDKYYQEQNANVHRGVHYLGRLATEQYEMARQKISKFINADESEIIFTKNGSEAINLVAYSWGRQNLRPGDEIVLSVAEHHSNIVPWQIIAKQTGSNLKYVQLSENQELDMQHYEKLLQSKKVKMVALTHASNMLGFLLDAKQVVEKAHSYNAKILLDCCQTMPHQKVDVKNLNCDFAVGTGHKIFGPTGIGILYGKYELLDSMDPFLGGGEMIADVFQDYSTYAPPPLRFEAGTPPIAEAITLGAACDYVQEVGMDNIYQYEQQIGEYLYQQLSKVEDIHIYGPKAENLYSRAPLVSFNIKGVHSLDLATLIDEKGVCLRSGHHCTQPLHQVLNISSSLRASLAFYNTKQEIDQFISALNYTIQFFK